MVNETDISLMDAAVKEAWKYQILTYPNPAVGAVISDEFDNIIAVNAHKKAGSPHAEVEVIKDTYYKITRDKRVLQIEDSEEIHNYLRKNHSNIFKKFNIYVTLEPCNHYGKTPPCSHLIKELGFKRVVIGMLDPNSKASGGAEYLRNNAISVDILQNSTSCQDLLFPFESSLYGNFIFFKLAMSLNGVIDGGIITSDASRELVHKFRDKIDLLVIGGNTVRSDRPTLDARMIDGKAPDILIYSKDKNFDRSIPLFNVKNRKVYIENDFELLKKYKFIMIEGGEGMLRATQDIVDMYVIFRSPDFKIGNHPNIELKLETLSCHDINKDTITWFTRART
ncbi:MAG: bifunctional diaminohydroxyphosphoribosylaminopyrimidine deaminase/5-amino-6-(5-phosphoribosylamino)uracil reductase RibD [Sulfurospirillaceae bacterium]|nr:bifunctional diaminohydroxyphosphoribosylaminopyrimidine deaminase/5-amino-6-(5-phosphoribosylamino)uracil reductase RibD [Sulfurospirillaceae bacterium]